MIPITGITESSLVCNIYGASCLLDGSCWTPLEMRLKELIQTTGLPDHVVYTQERRDEITEAMRTSGAEYLVTTEKDGVKLKGVSPELSPFILLARMEVTIDKPEILEERLKKLLQF